MASKVFTGGAKLQARLAELAQRFDSDASVSVGLHAGATYPDGTSVAMVGTVHEFGASARGIPPRPFMRPAVAQYSNGWGDVVADGVKSGADAKRIMGVVGEVMQGDIQQSITDVVSPPLAPETIARKGFDKPLVDSDLMRKSVDYEVQG